jgi:ABC-type transport system involved in multi-copper enzyme maturation permease subunit
VIRALFLRNLRHHAVPLAAASAGLFLFELLLVWVAARLDTGPGLRQFLEALLPPDVRDVIFGQLGLASFSGAVSFGLQHPFTMVGAIAMVVTAATVPAAERETGYLDLILGRPVPRWRYLTAVALLVAFASLLLPGALLGGAAAGISLVDAPGELPWTRYAPAAAGLALLLLCVGAYTLLLATDARRRGVAVGRAVAFTLAFYWMDFMGAYWDVLVHARRMSPFHYLDPAGAVESGLSAGHVLALAGATVALGVAAFWSFRRQDL